MLEIGHSNIRKQVEGWATDSRVASPHCLESNEYWYSLYSAQHSKLQAACSYDRKSALESASWGIGQVLGKNWKSLGYSSIQEFINAMFRDEAGQLDAMIRYIKVNKLVDDLNRHDWTGFARAYNGPNFAVNQYDLKLVAAYKLVK